MLGGGSREFLPIRFEGWHESSLPRLWFAKSGLRWRQQGGSGVCCIVCFSPSLCKAAQCTAGIAARDAAAVSGTGITRDVAGCRHDGLQIESFECKILNTKHTIKQGTSKALKRSKAGCGEELNETWQEESQTLSLDSRWFWRAHGSGWMKSGQMARIKKPSYDEA